MLPLTLTLTLTPVRSQVVRSSNDIRRDDATGRLTYADDAGGVTLITQEFTHRGFSRNLGEPEMEIRVRRYGCVRSLMSFQSSEMLQASCVSAAAGLIQCSSRWRRGQLALENHPYKVTLSHVYIKALLRLPAVRKPTMTAHSTARPTTTAKRPSQAKLPCPGPICVDVLACTVVEGPVPGL